MTDYASPGSFGLTNALCLFHEANNIVQDKVYLPPYSITPLTAHPYSRYVCVWSCNWLLRICYMTCLVKFFHVSFLLSHLWNSNA